MIKRHDLRLGCTKDCRDQVGCKQHKSHDLAGVGPIDAFRCGKVANRLMGAKFERDAANDIYDPFLGSGTSLVAADTTGRVCLGVEIDPLYVDVAIRRWQAFTDKEATLSSEDRSFAEIEAMRSTAGEAPKSASLSAEPAPMPATQEGDGKPEGSPAAGPPSPSSPSQKWAASGARKG